MQAKNKRAPTKAERAHIERIKAMPCGVCSEPGPSECHEINQGSGSQACRCALIATEARSTASTARNAFGLRCALTSWRY